MLYIVLSIEDNRRVLCLLCTVQFSSVMECVALSTRLNGTWRLHTVAIVLY